MKKFLVLLLLLALPIAVFAAQDKAETDVSYPGDKWIIDEDGDFVPQTDSASDIGASGAEVAVGYFDSIYLGGVAATGWGSSAGATTDADGYVYPTDSGGLVRFYDAGYISLGAGTEVDTYLLFDGSADDFYVALDDTADDFIIGYGSTIGTDARISVVDNAALTHVVIGDNVDAEDKYIIFDGNARDQYLGYLDTYDMVCMGDGSTMDADMCFGIEGAATPLLVLWNGIDGYGAVDLDYGSANITDHTFVSDGGTLIIDGTITLTSGEVISNATDDTVRIASNDLDTVLEIYSPYATNGDATLLFTADADEDAGDRMAIVHDGATNSMLFQSDTAVADTLATILTLAKTGVITTTAAINVEIDNASNDTVTDVLNIQHFTSGTADAGIGVGLTFDLENDNGTEEEHAYIDVVSTTATNGAEDTDVVIGVMTAGTLAEVVRIVAASSATTGDSVTITSNTTETDGIIDILKLTTSAVTGAAGMGLGISFQACDAGGAEEQGAIDNVLTTATDTSEVSDFSFKVQVAGAITEMFLIDGTGGIQVGGGGDVDYTLTFNANTNDGVITWMEDEDNFTIDDEVLISDSATIELFNYGADSANSDGDPYTVTLDPAPSALAAGMMVLFKASDANTGACSLNVNALGEKPIKKLHDQNPESDHIEAGQMVLVAYDGTNWQILDGNDANP